MVIGFTAPPLNSGTDRSFSLSMTARRVSRDFTNSIWLDISASLVDAAAGGRRACRGRRGLRKGVRAIFDEQARR